MSSDSGGGGGPSDNNVKNSQVLISNLERIAELESQIKQDRDDATDASLTGAERRAAQASMYRNQELKHEP